MKNTLWLPSWYPCRTDPFNGDFIQRHAIATASFVSIVLLYIVPCPPHLLHGKKETTQTTNGNLTEIIIYYRKPGNGVLQRVLSFFRRNILYYKAIRQYLKTHGKPHAVHVHEAAWVGWWALWLKRKYKIPYFITEHWTAFHRQVPHSVYKWSLIKKTILKQVFKQSKLILPVSEDLKTAIESFTGANNVKVIRNVADTTVFNYQPRAVNTTFTFIHVSAFGPAKNPKGLIRGFSNFLTAAGAIARLKLVGPVPDSIMQWAEENISAAHLAEIEFIGALPYTEVAAQIKQSDAFVLFSDYENFPCVVIEALCCGVPVLSTNVGGIAEAIHAENGKLITAGDESELQAAFNWFIQNSSGFNPQTISQQAQSTYSYETIGRTIASLYA